jgi:Tol biopolymer transport system component
MRQRAIALLVTLLTLLTVMSGCHLLLSMDDTRILYSSDHADGLGNQIYIMRSDIRQPIRLTDWALADNNYPAWSPDGTKIAFTSRHGDPAMSDIYVMNADGRNKVDASNSLDIMDQNPVWSPDGRKIAFLSGPVTPYQLCVMNTDGSGQSALTATGVTINLPFCWSPDSKKIAYSFGGGPAAEIGVADINSGLITVLTSNTVQDQSPSWSPDGKWIAYNSPAVGNINSNHIWIMDQNGNGARDIYPIPNSSYYLNPKWSPNGKKIAYLADNAGVSSIWIAFPDGGNPICVSSDFTVNTRPQWSQSGRQFLCIDSTNQIRIVNANGSGQQNLTNNTTFHDSSPSWAPR